MLDHAVIGEASSSLGALVLFGLRSIKPASAERLAFDRGPAIDHHRICIRI